MDSLDATIERNINEKREKENVKLNLLSHWLAFISALTIDMHYINVFIIICSYIGIEG